MNIELPENEPEPCDLSPGDLETGLPHAEEAFVEPLPGEEAGDVGPLLNDLNTDVGDAAPPVVEADLRQAASACDDELFAEEFEDDDEFSTANPFATRALENDAPVLRDDDQLPACLDRLIAQQICLADLMFGMVTEVISDTPRNLETLERLAKPVAVFQTVHRQIDRYSQTKLRIEESERKTSQQCVQGDRLRGFKLDSLPHGRRLH